MVCVSCGRDKRKKDRFGIARLGDRGRGKGARGQTRKLLSTALSFPANPRHVLVLHPKKMASGKKNRGGMKPWYTEEQQAWFTEHLPPYVASRATKAPAEFWPPIFEDWFTKWPLTIAEGEMGNEEEVLAGLMTGKKEVSRYRELSDVFGCDAYLAVFDTQQIKNWFKNHKGSLMNASAIGRSRVLDLTGKHTKIRKLSGANAYSKLFFKTKVKPVVEEKWKAHYLAKNPGQPTGKIPRWPIPFQNKILHDLWKAEPEDVRADVRRQFGLDEAEDSEEEEAVSEGEDPEQQAERRRSQRTREYQKYVICLGVNTWS
jgi:hypothetical protein